MATGLFHVDMLAGLERGNGHGRVPVLGRGDGDGIHVLHFEDGTEILFGDRRLAHLVRGLVGKLLQRHGVNVAYMSDARGGPV